MSLENFDYLQGPTPNRLPAEFCPSKNVFILSYEKRCYSSSPATLIKHRL